MVSIIITAIISFFSTNIDDVIILMLFFSQVNAVMKKRDIIIGQYLGIGVLTMISILGALGISVIQKEYVGLLGLVPIYLGVKTDIDYKRNNKSTDNQKLEKDKFNMKSRIGFIKKLVNPSVLKVFSVTFANGGDNIGVYILLFTSMNLVEIFETVIIFMFLIAFWCFIAVKLSEYPFIHKNIERYKHIFVPIIFIGLGFFILLKNGTINYFLNRL